MSETLTTLARVFIVGLVVFGLLYVFLMTRSTDTPDQRRARAAYREWARYNAGVPDPADARYNDWNQGGAERWMQDVCEYAKHTDTTGIFWK